MTKLLAQLLGSILTLKLAQLYLPGVMFEGELAALVLAGLFLGLLNFFITSPFIEYTFAPILAFIIQLPSNFSN